MSKLYLDVGHGGRDPGAIGKHSKEKDNVLKVAKKLKTLLEGYGHVVRLSRSSDKYLTLSQRASDANRWGADYFISLHNNSAVNKSATGFETFIYNGSISSKTKAFQSAVHDAIASQIGIRDRGKKRANFAVVRQTNMPAMLIEYAFISNTDDEKILIDKVNKLAEWTCEGIINYLGGSIKAKPSKPKKPSKPASKPTGQVATIQSTLNSRYGFNIAVDNIAGPETRKALVKAYQTELNKQYKKGLVVDGLPGPKTDAAGITIRKGAKGNLTWIMQAMLYIAGYDPQGIDGHFGDKTEKAVRDFQRANQLVVDGVPGIKTFAKLIRK